MKVPRTKSLMTLIYMALLALPLCAILGRVVYSQINKNAYQSYSGKTQTTEYIETSNFELGDDYLIKPVEFSTTTNINIWFVNNGGSIGGDYYNQLQNVDKITLRTDNKIVFYSDNIYQFEFTYNQFDWSINIELGGISPYNDTTIEIVKRFLFVPDTASVQYLDNAFDYSINEVIKEGNIGKLDFFSWFTDFLLNDNAKNNLYVNFANWYLNYAMVISLMQILFLCLMWFVNFSRRLLERGMNYDW